MLLEICRFGTGRLDVEWALGLAPGPACPFCLDLGALIRPSSPWLPRGLLWAGLSPDGLASRSLPVLASDRTSSSRGTSRYALGFMYGWQRQFEAWDVLRQMHSPSVSPLALPIAVGRDFVTKCPAHGGLGRAACRSISAGLSTYVYRVITGECSALSLPSVTETWPSRFLAFCACLSIGQSHFWLSLHHGALRRSWKPCVIRDDLRECDYATPIPTC